MLCRGGFHWLVALSGGLSCFQVRELAHSIDIGLEVTACGSFRRGKATCGDVDCLVTHPDGRSHRGVFAELLKRGRESGV